MAVGQLFLDAFLQVLFDRLASRELLNFARREGLGKKLDKWRKTLSRIQAVLDDADVTPRDYNPKSYLVPLIRNLCSGKYIYFFLNQQDSYKTKSHI